MKTPFGFGKASSNSILGIPRKRGLFNNELMQVISEEIGTASTSMAIIDPKERTFWPLFMLAIGWL
jgi:hypothetical protein